MAGWISILILFSVYSQASEVLVRIKNLPGTMNSFIQRAESLGYRTTRIYQLVPGLMRVDVGVDLEAAITALKADDSVLYVEPNYIRRPAVDPSQLQFFRPQGPLPALPKPQSRSDTWKKDPKDYANYGMNQNRTHDIIRKRKFYGSEEIIIAILDTGVDYSHRDLSANMWRNPGESGLDDDGQPKESNGKDDDGNGYIDDVVGYDFQGNNPLPFDDLGHGTHVAGIAAAVGGNGIDSLGHCPRCRIMGLKFIGKGGGTDADAIAGLEYAALMGAHVINSSWGGTGYSQALFDAFEATSKMGILNSVAAGNDGIDLSFQIPNTYPAEFSMPGMYTIAALYEVNIQLTWWSNYSRQIVHMSSAGDGVPSTMPGNRFAPMSGTSMAAPAVAGCLGLMKSYRPQMGFGEIDHILRSSILGDPRSIGDTMFRGRPNMAKAFDLVDKMLP